MGSFALRDGEVGGTKFSKVISLGRACDVAYQIRRHFNQAEAYLFDWLVTPFDGLVKTIQSDFAGFLDAENLALQGNSIISKHSEVIFFHDFEKGAFEKIDEVLPSVAEKYDRRIARWREVVNTGDPVLFVRGSQNVGAGILTEGHAQSIYQALVQAYPHCDVHLLVQNEPKAGIEPRRIGRIWMDDAREPQPFTWQGDDAAWSELLSRHAG